MFQNREVIEERLAEAMKTATPVEWKEPPSWLPPTLHSLAYRNFFLLFLGQLSNSLGLWMDLVARPILVIALTGSPVHVGLVTMARGAPMMFLGPISGVLADRVDRRMLMFIAKVLTLVINVVFAVIIITGSLELWHVYVTAVIKSVLMAFDRPARQALLPSLVPPRLLMNAVALNMGSMQMVRIFSASLAGIFIAAWATAFGFSDTQGEAFGGVYVAVAASYIVAVVSTYMLQVPAAGRVTRTNDSWAGSFMQGVRFAWHNPIILGVMILLAIQSVFGMPYLQVFVPWLALQVMDLGPQGAGLLMATSAVGSLLAALFVATYGEVLRRKGLLVIIGMVIYGGALAALGVSSTFAPVAVFGLMLPLVPVGMIVVAGIGQTTIQAMKNGLLLQNTPNELRGRVMSLHQMDRGLSTVGGSLAGFAIAVFGGPYGLAIFGVLCALGAVGVALLSPGLRKAE